MKNTNNLEKYVKTKAKKALDFFMTDTTGGDNIKSVDFYSVLNSNFSMNPHSVEDREHKLKQVKSKLNLKLLQNIDKRSILNNKRVGDERDGLVFNKINPKNLNPNIRPNSFDWTTQEFNRKIIDRTVKQEEENENIKKANEELEKKIEDECVRLTNENKNI